MLRFEGERRLAGYENERENAHGAFRGSVKNQFLICDIARVAVFAVAIGSMIGATSVRAQDGEAAANVPEALAKRMAAEKDARRACKIEICQAFADGKGGDPITCDVTKTWLRSEIVSRITGGDYVWGYGHTQCSMKLNLSRDEIAKAATQETAEVAFPEHELVCNVDKKDAAEKAFTVTVKVTPAAKFEKREAKSASLEPVKTEGSTVASAAVGSIMAVDQVSGIVSSAVASEINQFLYTKCKDDGVEIARQN